MVRHVAELLSLRPAAAERVEAFWTLHAVLARCRAPDCPWYQFIARKLEEKAEAGALAPRSREVRSLMHALGQPPPASAARWSVLNVFRPTPLAASWAEERELVFADATWDLGSAPGAGAFVCRLVHALEPSLPIRPPFVPNAATPCIAGTPCYQRPDFNRFFSK